MTPELPVDSFGVPLRNTYPEDMDRWKFHRNPRRLALRLLSSPSAILPGCVFHIERSIPK
jgi:hypothetical protein